MLALRRCHAPDAFWRRKFEVEISPQARASPTVPRTAIARPLQYDPAMAPGFSVHLSGTDDRCLVVVGDLDGHTRDLLEPELHALDIGSDVVLDLSGLTFIDSGGLSLLLIYHSRHEEAGSRLKIRNPSAAFLRLLELAGLVNYFTTDDQDDQRLPT